MTKLLSKDTLAESIKNRQHVRGNIEQYHKEADWGTFELAMLMLNPQSYGAQFERRIREAYGWTKNFAKDRNGDANYFLDSKKVNTEVKVSVVLDEEDRIHIVQIRPSHGMDYYDIFIIFNGGSPEHYRISKEQMAEELVLTGNNLAHGTIGNSDNDYEHAEYRIDFYVKENDETYKRWQKYLINDISTLTDYVPEQEELEAA